MLVFFYRLNTHFKNLTGKLITYLITFQIAFKIVMTGDNRLEKNIKTNTNTTIPNIANSF